MSEPEFVQTDVSSAEPEIGLVRTALLTPPKRNGNALLLLASAAAFALVALRDRSMADVLILLGVLLFHELGHLAGMKLFGYRDVRMFFIPFFGAAVSGRPMATTAWHEAVVLLLGPLPGIVIAIPALVFSIAFDSAIARDAAFMLIAINAFNLLPLAPLDGGRLFQLLLFSRQRLLEGAFLLCAAVGLVGAALLFQDWVLGLLGAIMLGSAVRQWRITSEAQRLRAAAPGLDGPPESIPDEALRTLYRSAARLVPQTTRNAPAVTAETMREIHQRVRRRPPGLGATVGLGSLWLLGVFAAAIGGFLYVASLQSKQELETEATPAISDPPADQSPERRSASE